MGKAGFIFDLQFLYKVVTKEGGDCQVEGYQPNRFQEKHMVKLIVYQSKVADE